ncbi:NAD(P)H-dependent nitrite reductase flavoprotein subunit [Neorhodopirellula lusitana]|uniref:NAD(P)H-dependent nitrite reductase flavoprotein subunit n=1 Tax=Neorhodopirellula lusitana TaxID=445327 RepID=A0ABY1QHM5_9BACT|nr:sulfite reductase subunit alpha [Neorhodopirellula lusitana]SMP71734.1 NAD(P)H-dependent nitrite reductase flavoprotein subunit [Neorhodopirellula lusitana]
MTSYIPQTAPFNEEQRAWLNGFFAGLTGVQSDATASAAMTLGLAAAGAAGGAAVAEPEEEEDFPWHDAALPIVDRMELAENKPVERKLMAAMAQLDCGSCGYLCQSYSEAIANGDEKNLTLCSPGGKETKQMLKKILAEAPAANGDSNGKAVNGNGQANGVSTNGKAAQWSRQNPYSAKLIEARGLNNEGSAKDTRHVVIDLTGSGLKYNVGDALGVFPTNCGELAKKLIAVMAADANVTVESPMGDSKSLLDALTHDCCLKDPSDELLELLVGRIADESDKATLETMLEDGVPDGFDVLDVFEVAKGATVTATEVIETLEPLNPRLYSIASSMNHVGDQVHLTVGKVVYEREGRVRKGVASTMLAERIAEGETVRVFVQPNHAGFTVPADTSKPIIMVGPGTGIAPFVSFLQERAVSKATGKNWLFFGDQHEAYDFLYEEDLRQYQSDGLLTRLDTAFSRDGDTKVYVQDRMRQSGAELWKWLSEGGSFYVCGDASRMAKDVDRALHDIAAEHGNMTDEQAKAFIKQLAADGRYHRDVY